MRLSWATSVASVQVLAMVCSVIECLPGICKSWVQPPVLKGKKKKKKEEEEEIAQSTMSVPWKAMSCVWPGPGLDLWLGDETESSHPGSTSHTFAWDDYSLTSHASEGAKP